ncbi:MAG: carboxypeptidase-like regulatory domain-containing protein [Gemmatimonadaceae bacterium]
MKLSGLKARIQLALLLSVSIPFAPLSAQQAADVIRGRVMSPDSQPIVGAQVTAISYLGGITKSKRTDKNGRYSITYPNGEGDYWLSFAAIGYTGQRFEVKRIADEEVLIADVKLSNTQTLGTVTINAAGPRQPPGRNDGTQSADVTGGDRSIANVLLPPDQMGNLAAMAGAMAGVQLIPGVDGNPDKFSIFGLDGSQNNTSLNGQQSGATTIPRDAGVSTQLRSGFDIANGGFSGAQIAVNTSSGTNYISRSGSGQFNAPQIQWNDRIGRATEYSSISLGGRMSGPIVMDKDFYTFSIQVDHRSQNLATLGSTTPVIYQSAGIAADSVTRLRAILGDLRVPIGASGIGSSSPRDAASVLGGLDWAPKSASSGHAFNLAYNGSYNSSGPSSLSPLQTPASLSSTTSLNGSMQLRHTNFFGDGILTESMFALSGSSARNNPYVDLPGGSVLVTSILDDGSATPRSLNFGGGSNASTNSTQSVSGRNSLSWFSSNNKHRLKLISELRTDRSSSERAFNLLGRYTYQSLADLSAGHPSSFTRSLNSVDQSGSALVGAIALGDAWRKTPNLQIQYGVRIDGNRFLSRPDDNSAVKDAFGIANTNVPNKIYLSPRFGFSYFYGKQTQIAIADGFAFGPKAVIRGGSGIFQNVRGPDLASGAIANTGLPGSSQQITCTGTATPAANWDVLQGNDALIPTQCADGTGGTLFANSLPSVTLFNKGYSQEKSWRTNMSWAGNILDNRFALTLTGNYSLNFNQADALDLNFSPVQQFALSEESGRPVYVQSTSIDPTSGLIATRDSRQSSLFNTVSELRSDLHSQTRQLQVQLQPFYFYAPKFRWNMSYAYVNVSQQYRGFSSTVGDPFEIRTGTASGPRHDLSLGFVYSLANAVTFSLGARVASGTRFTPTIAGDVNGDGRFNDRAFIFDPATTSDPAVAAAMQNLLKNASGSARDCLQSQLGKFAERNSCVSSWTVSNTSLRITINPAKIRLPNRTSLSLTISNPAGAADLLLHGENKLHGWGQTPNIDQSLLYVRGYDAAKLRYKYEVNQRFGSTRALQTVSRTPVVMTLIVGVDFAPTRDWQNLRQQLDRGRTRAGVKMPEPQVRQMSLSLFQNPMARMLQTGEALHLTRTQADSLATMSRRYTKLVDSLWTPAAKFLATLPKEYDRAEAQARFVAAREVAIGYLIKVAPGIKGMLTKGQTRVLSPQIASVLEPRYLQLVQKGLAGGEFAYFF